MEQTLCLQSTWNALEGHPSFSVPPLSFLAIQTRSHSFTLLYPGAAALTCGRTQPHQHICPASVHKTTEGSKVFCMNSLRPHRANTRNVSQCWGCSNGHCQDIALLWLLAALRGGHVVSSFQHPRNADIVETKQKLPYFRKSRLLIHEVIFQPEKSIHFTKGYIRKAMGYGSIWCLFILSKGKISIFVHHGCT